MIQADLAKISELLDGLQRDMRSSHSLRDVLDKMLTRIMGLIGAERGDFALWDDARKDLVIEAVYGPRTVHTLKVGAPAPKRSFIRSLWGDKSRPFKISPNVAKERAYYQSNEKTKSEVAVRFEIDGKRGILNAESFKENAFNSADAQFLRMVSPCAAAVRTLVKEEIRLWDNVGGVLKYSASLHSILGAILKSLAELHKLSGLIYLADDKHKRLDAVKVCADADVRRRAKGFFYRYDDPAAATLVRRLRRPIFICDPLHDPRVNQDGRGIFGIKGPMVLLPLLYGRSAVGVLVAWANAEPFATKGHLQRLRRFARLAAAKIAMWQAEQQHRQAEKEVRASEKLYHSLVENIPLCILRKNLKEEFTFANERFCRMLGQPLGEIVGKTDLHFYPRELAEKYQRDDRYVIQSGKAFETIEENQRDGEKIYVYVLKTPLYDDGGKIIGVQGIFRDITAEKKAQEELQEYGATTFHCLSGPLFQLEGTLIQAAEIKAQYKQESRSLPPEFAKLLSLLRASCGSLEFYLKNLKRFLGAELDFKSEPVVLLMQEEAWYFGEFALDKLRVRLVNRLPSDLLINIDQAFFVAAIKELLLNAFKGIRRRRADCKIIGKRFKGKVVVGLDWTPADDFLPGRHVRISILDTGDASVEPQAFAELQRHWDDVVKAGKRFRCQKGLFFVNWVLQKHGGYWQIAKYNHGIGFHLHLPIRSQNYGESTNH